jgi:hypothetical protein
MIYSWALTTFAPENLEQQLQYSTQYFPTEQLSWFQGWMFNSFQTEPETSSPSSAFANNLGQTEVPEPPCFPNPPCPAPPPPTYIGGLASEEQRILSVQWSYNNDIHYPDTLLENCCEFYVLSRTLPHVYRLRVEEPFTNAEVEHHCYCWVFNDYYGWYDQDLSLSQLITDNWSTFYPPIHTNIVIITMESSIIAGDNPIGPWAPLDYPSTADLMKEPGDLCYDWNDPTHEQNHDLGELCYDWDDPNHDSTRNDDMNPATSTDTQWTPLS